MRVDPDDWQAVAEHLSATRGWTDEAIRIDCAFWRGQRLVFVETDGVSGVDRLPSREVLMERWGVPERRARALRSAMTGERPKIVPAPNGSTCTICAKRPSAVPAESESGTDGALCAASESPDQGGSSLKCPENVPAFDGDTPAFCGKCTGSVPGMSRGVCLRSSSELDLFSEHSPTQNNPKDAVLSKTAREGLPAWAEGKPPARLTRQQYADTVVEAIRLIRRKQPNPDRCGTDAKAVRSLWRSLGWQPPAEFLADVGLVADAAHDCPDPLFARDIRAEGWTGGTDRSSSVATVCVQDRWTARLDRARQWRAGRLPVNASVDPFQAALERALARERVEAANRPDDLEVVDGE